MRQEHLMERQAKFVELAGKAYDLWGRILEAQVDYLNEYSPALRPQYGQLLKPIFEWKDGRMVYAEDQPLEMDLNEKAVNFEGKSEEVHKTYNEYSGQAGMAQYLFNLVLKKAGNLPDASKFKSVPRKKPTPQKPKATFSATTRSDEEITDYTTSVVEKITSDLDHIHGQYGFEKTEQARKRQFITGATTLHASTGGESIEKKVRNRFIVVQDDLSQVVLWMAQAGGPRHAPFLQLPADRISFTLAKINLGKPADNHMDGEMLWGYIEEAAEQKLLTDMEDPKITTEGIEHIRERLAQDYAIAEDRPLLRA
jgi:hypothetical protein